MEALGSALVINVPESARGIGAEYTVSVKYSTHPEKCTAVQWLPPEQTAGKTSPYMFTQCQAIHARSMVPCQDTPGVKMKYTAEITVPKVRRRIHKPPASKRKKAKTKKESRKKQPASRLALKTYENI